MTPEQEQEILKLRALNVTPKQIARKLGLKGAEVTAFIKDQAQEAAIVRENTGELAPIDKCLVDTKCAERLLFNTPGDDLDDDQIGGLGLVLISRKTGYNRYSVCTYLVDYWCLGLKDTLGPKELNGNKYTEFLHIAYKHFPYGYREITLEQAQEIVFGAIDYATSLGFNPHQDFEQSRIHLEEWYGPSQLNFGREGKPFFVGGPYDNSSSVINTLQKSVGEGNFDYFSRL